MEKYYCDRCCRIYKDLQTCKPCGILASRKIVIQVHDQPKPQ